MRDPVLENVVLYRTSLSKKGAGKRLADALGVPIVVRDNTKNRGLINDDTIIINWGRSQDIDGVPPCFYINMPFSVGMCVDKVRTLCAMHSWGVPALSSTTVREDAKEMLARDGCIVVRRTTTGSRGRGCELVYDSTFGTERLPVAPLYTEFYDKTHEFRVHVMDGEVIDYRQKKKMGKEKLTKRGIGEVDMFIRNHKRGWVFAKNDILRFKEIEETAVDAAGALRLHFCAVDILAKVDDNGQLIDHVVCEVNSAPNLVASTMEAYVNGLVKLVKRLKEE